MSCLSSLRSWFWKQDRHPTPISNPSLSVSKCLLRFLSRNRQQGKRRTRKQHKNNNIVPLKAQGESTIWVKTVCPWEQLIEKHSPTEVTILIAWHKNGCIGHSSTERILYLAPSHVTKNASITVFSKTSLVISSGCLGIWSSMFSYLCTAR